MKAYTEALHAERLKQMLRFPNPAECCPGADGYDICKALEGYDPDEICAMCRSFVGATDCPCRHFGDAEAIRLTRVALREKGYTVLGQVKRLLRKAN